MHVLFIKILQFKYFLQCCKGRVWRGTKNDSEQLIIISVQEKFGADHCALQKEEHHTKCHTAWSLLYHGLATMFFYFIFFFPSQANGRRAAYIGMLLGLSVFKSNSWASTPPPLPATMSQTLTFLVGGWGGGHCAVAVGCDNVQKLTQMQSRADLLTHGFSNIIIMLKVAVKESLLCWNCWLLKSFLKGWRWNYVLSRNTEKTVVKVGVSCL